MSARTRTQAVYVISVAAELAGMHPQTLRIYERRGLVAPARTQGGNRRYSDDDIEVLRRIAELTGEGMNLEGIRRVMRLEADRTPIGPPIGPRSVAVIDLAREIWDLDIPYVVAAPDRCGPNAGRSE